MRPDPTRIAQMAASLRRLDAVGNEAEAIRALSFHGSYSSVEIALHAGKALAKARQYAVEARAH